VTDTQLLTRLFYPRSVAIVGASSSPTKIGAVPVSLLAQHGYGGKLYPINPAAETVQGMPAFESLTAVKAPVDLAIVSVPAARVLPVLHEALELGTKNFVLFSSGFAEAGEAGRLQQQQLTELALGHGANILGPNCLGFMNIRERVFATFCTGPAGGLVQPGNVAIVSQSGAFAGYAYTLARERGLGLSHWITTGNQCSIDVADCIAWLAGDPQTRVIMVYMEGCTDGEKLKDALAKAYAAGKPVVACKVGRTSSGAQAAASHTAAMAGDDAVYSALFKQYGVARAYTVEEFFNLGYAFSVADALPSNRDIGLLTMSGGVGALMADDAQIAGLTMSPLPEAARQSILRRVPFAGVNNPVDITGQATSEMDLLSYTARLMLDEGRYGSLVVFVGAVAASPALWPHVREFVCDIRSAYPDTPLVLSCTIAPANKQDLESLGCLVFSDPSTAIHMVRALCSRRDGRPPRGLPGRTGTGTVAFPERLGEAASFALLEAAGIPTVCATVCANPREAVAAARRSGYPVVMKIASADIAHKSDVGGVRLAIADDASVESAFSEIMATVAANAPTAALDGVLVAPMVKGGVECILGAHIDPVFGPVVMFGLGGVFVEVLKDVSFRLAPIDEDEARSMVAEIRGAPLLAGARGAEPSDIQALCRAIAALSEFAAANREGLSSIDVNPLAVLPEGSGCIALDAVIVPRAWGRTH